MTRHALHRIRTVRKGLLENLSPGEPEVPRNARAARALVDRYILDSAAGGIREEIEGFLKSNLRAAWTFAGDLVRIARPASPELPEIPDSHCWKGGAARLLLRRALALPELPYPVRDLDIARVGRGWSEADIELSKRYMADDYAHGHGVEIVEDRARYFRSRDLSINELLAGNTELTCTVVCVLDTFGRILRPCRYFSGTLHQPAELPSRGSAKMVRFRAEFLAAGESWALAGVPVDQEVDAQHLAFEVNKAFSRGEAIGWKMISTAMALGLLPKPLYEDEGDPLFDALAGLIDETYGGITFYTAFPPELQARFAGDKSK